MIVYHGTPITPDDVAVKVLAGRHAMVSFYRPDQLAIVAECCESFAVDNGAFSAWRSGAPVNDWQPYHDWLIGVYRIPGFQWAVIPDVIDGTVSDNRKLIEQWPTSYALACPVWHMHEPLEWLRELVSGSCFDRLAIGSSGEYDLPGARHWWRRIEEAMEVICDEQGRPRVQLHGMRMADPDIASRIPFASVDSTTVARNIGIDGRWTGSYTPPTKSARAEVIASRMEHGERAVTWQGAPKQLELNWGLGVTP